MKKVAIILFFCVFLSTNAFSQVNGHLTDLGDRYLIHVWGSHYERGYAMGYLMGDEIMNVFRYYFFTNVCGSSANTYNYYQEYATSHFLTDPRYESEYSGMIAGMTDAGTDIYHSSLGRNLNVFDLAYVNAIVDINAGSKDTEFGCSSLSSWGSSTTSDPELGGTLQITRLLDWTRNNTLVNHATLVIHHPSEPNERKWMSFTYPGLIGALSGITEDKSAAFLNMGNVHSLVNEEELTAVLLDVRDGLEILDYNQDLVHDTGDIFSALSQGNHKNGTIIQAVQQWPDSLQAYVFETNNTGTVKRGAGVSSDLPGDNLAATNHFRLLADPVYCSRYSKIVDSLAVSTDVSIERQWRLMRGAGGVSHNMMMIQYIPQQNRAMWSIATAMSPAYQRPPLELDLNQLFTWEMDNWEDEISPGPSPLRLYPNPIRRGQAVKVEQIEQGSELRIFNIRGQEIYRSRQSVEIPSEIFEAAGIYYLKLVNPQGKKFSLRLVYLD